jgi:hypothetical protein
MQLDCLSRIRAKGQKAKDLHSTMHIMKEQQEPFQITVGILRCFGMVSSCYCTIGIRRVNLVTNLLISCD